jgi:hypothetical protein
VSIVGAGAKVVRIVQGLAEGNVIESVGPITVVIRGVTLAGMGGGENGASAAVSVLDSAAITSIEDTSIENLVDRVDGGGIFAAGSNLVIERSLIDTSRPRGVAPAETRVKPLATPAWAVCSAMTIRCAGDALQHRRID